jgi:uncharacterized protein YydD (DUF2326 family)
MRLLKLSANKASFRTVAFNRSGLSFVVGAKKSPDDSPRNRTKTYNGVGKSLMVELIHFCLGSNANAAFKKHLSDWTFSLAVEIDETTHVVSRSSGTPSDITLNGEEISLKKFREWLLGKCFEPVADVKGLSFRSLISPFIRSGRGAYERFDRADENDAMNPYWAMIRNAFLLGLDLHLAQKKYDLRSRQTSLTKTMKELESDPLFAEFFAEDTAGIELTALREEEARLDADLRGFTVAENYQSIQQDANTLKRDAEAARRELVKVTESIAQIDRSLETKGDLDPTTVKRLYAEAERALPERIQKQIDDVLTFQRELQQRRVFRLTGERQELERARSELQVRVKDLSAKLEEAIRYLGSHVALDEYLAVNQRLGEIRQQIARLEASNDQREKVTRELKTIALDLAEQSIKTDDYLTTAKALNDEANGLFRRFTRALYGNRASGLSITNDGGETLTRYKIEAHINSDAAEGINEAKIFCYDLMVVALRRGHSIECLLHDSSLFHPIDCRQRWSMLKLVDTVCKDLGIQYVATLNEHDVLSMAPPDAEERALFDEMFSAHNIVLRLTDESAREKLLGVEIDMNYREKSATRPVEDPAG